MRRVLPWFCLVLLLSIAWVESVPNVEARVPSPGGVLYKLRDGSSFQEGCIGGLCLCPVALSDKLRGSFLLRPVAPVDEFTEYAVESVEWMLGVGSGIRRVTGSGVYRASADAQQLILDLRVEGGPLEHYDSGLVPRYPGSDIDVSIAMETLCFGMAFGLRAARAPFRGGMTISLDEPAYGSTPSSSESQHSWGALKADWRD